MPGAGLDHNRHHRWSKNVLTSLRPVVEGLHRAMRTLSTRLSPWIGGNSSGQGNLCALWTSVDDGARLSTMPSLAVCPRFSHSVIHRNFPAVGKSMGCAKHMQNHAQTVIGQKTTKCSNALIYLGWSEVPPCFPQAVPHNPWKVFHLWKQGFAVGLWRVSRKICDKLSTSAVWHKTHRGASPLPQAQMRRLWERVCPAICGM